MTAIQEWIARTFESGGFIVLLRQSHLASC